MPAPEKITLSEKFATFDEHWAPRVVAELNGQHVKIVKLRGEFEWHAHAGEDELFWVLSGSLQMHFRDRVVVLQPGEMIVVPRGVEHKPACEQEVHVVLFEPKSTVNTGDQPGDRTVEAKWT